MGWDGDLWSRVSGETLTLEGDDDNLLSTIFAPLLEMTNAVNQDASIDNDYICILCGLGRVPLRAEVGLEGS